MSQTLMGRCGDRVDAFELAGEYLSHYWAEIAEDGMTATLEWVEDLRFHEEALGSRFVQLLHEPGGFLSDSGEEAVQEAARTCFIQQASHLSEDLIVDLGAAWDDPSIAFSVQVDLPDGPATTYGILGELAWPFIATMTNITDPGTFNCPYLMAEAVEVWGRRNL